METMAQRRDLMDDLFHLPNFPHMAWVNPSALPNDSSYTLTMSPTRMHFNFIVSYLRHYLPSGAPSICYSLLTMLDLQWMECVICCHTPTTWSTLGLHVWWRGNERAKKLHIVVTVTYRRQSQNWKYFGKANLAKQFPILAEKISGEWEITCPKKAIYSRLAELKYIRTNRRKLFCCL